MEEDIRAKENHQFILKNMDSKKPTEQRKEESPPEGLRVGRERLRDSCGWKPHP